jgi:Domain of unknown function (DUF4365)
MLTQEDIREQLSFAYLHAVSARAGYAWEPVRIDRDGIDGRVHARGEIVCGASVESPSISFQLKATSSLKNALDPIPFCLRKKNYDELRGWRWEPRYLALLVLPRDPVQWLQSNDHELSLRQCMYWCSLEEEPANGNRQSTTVYVPRKNILDVNGLRTLMEAAANRRVP